MIASGCPIGTWDDGIRAFYNLRLQCMIVMHETIQVCKIGKRDEAKPSESQLYFKYAYFYYDVPVLCAPRCSVRPKRYEANFVQQRAAGPLCSVGAQWVASR